LGGSTKRASAIYPALPAHPLAQAQASARNAILQTVDTDLSDFNYKPSLRAGFASTFPAGPYTAMRSTAAFREAWPLAPLWVFQGMVALISLLAIAGISWRTPRATGANREPSDAVLLAVMIVLGVVANGVVCGVLSTLYGRYQARVEWLLPLAAAVLFLVRTRARTSGVRMA
jgi:hypothetical protein